MKLLTRSLGREIYFSIALVFAALLMLFSFFDLIHELNILGSGYHLGYAALFVLLSVPGRMYELFPVAVLIGAIIALTHMAMNSELTVYRASGVSLRQMIMALLKTGLPLVLLSFLCGELIAPLSEQMAKELRLKAQNAEIRLKEFRSGVWAKDERSFVNIKNVLPDTTLLNISIYEFDEIFHLRSIISAKRAVFVEKNHWTLEGVTQTIFTRQGTAINHQDRMEWRSALNLGILRALLAGPDQMSVVNLYQYIQHLRDNRQKTVSYEIALWNKLVYPATVLVMLLLALPFAAQQRREGGISAKVFTGILLGLTFHFVDKLFSNLGAINEWQPVLIAIAMPVMFLMLASWMLWKTERR